MSAGCASSSSATPPDPQYLVTVRGVGFRFDTEGRGELADALSPPSSAGWSLAAPHGTARSVEEDVEMFAPQGREHVRSPSFGPRQRLG